MIKRSFKKIAATILFLSMLLVPNLALAEIIGDIDSTHKYAWSENIGWINFKPVGPNIEVSVRDGSLQGYAWSDSLGWIHLNPTNGGVINDNNGNLSGSAWGESTGWIDFSGVVIDADGYFTGYANGTVTGQISFNCSNTSSCGSQDFKVRTNWRPMSSRTEPTPPTSVEGGTNRYDVILINNNDNFTDSKDVILNLSSGPDVKEMAISNNNNLSAVTREPFSATKEWNICPDGCTAGDYTVYAQFYDEWGATTGEVYDTIYLRPEAFAGSEPTGTTPTPPPGGGGGGGSAVLSTPTPSPSPSETPEISPSPTPEVSPTPITLFPDVETHRYKDAISYVQSHGIVDGYPDGTYGPDKKINRAEFMKIIVNSAYPGEAELKDLSNCFSDVETDWYAKYVCLGKEKNLINGYPDGSFKPSQNLNLVEALKISLFAYNKPVEEETGVFWYRQFLVFAVENSLSFINEVDPWLNISRGQMAEIIYWLEMMA